MEKKPICSTCELMEREGVKCGRAIFYCMHPDAHTECLPHRIIARSREEQVPIKTAPKWCPLRQEGE